MHKSINLWSVFFGLMSVSVAYADRLTGSAHEQIERNRGFYWERETGDRSLSFPVTGIGEIRDKVPANHGSKGHILELLMEANGETFDVVDSPAIAEAHETAGEQLFVKFEGDASRRELSKNRTLKVTEFHVIEGLKSQDASKDSKPARRMEPFMIDKGL